MASHKPKTPEIETPAEELVIRVPHQRDAAGYAARQIHVPLTLAQADTLRNVFAALRDRHAQLACGRHVDTAADAVRWLIEAIGQRPEARRPSGL